MFIAAASAWYLANLRPGNVTGLLPYLRAGVLDRTAEIERRAQGLGGTTETANLWRHHFEHQSEVFASVARFVSRSGSDQREADSFIAGLRASLPSPAWTPTRGNDVVYRRLASVRGPMEGFGYSWLDDRLTRAGLPRPALLSRPAGPGPSYAYEALNLVDGRRSVGRIRDDLAASIGPVPVEEVAAFLQVVEKVGAIAR